MNKELLEAQKELLSSSFNHAMAYTNIIILGGYASFFAIWNFTKPHLSKEQILWSALLMTASLMSFVAFEIYGMILRSHSILRLAKAVKDPENFEALLGEYQNQEKTKVTRYGRVWVVALVISVATGFSAASILVWAFIRELLRLYS